MGNRVLCCAKGGLICIRGRRYSTAFHEYKNTRRQSPELREVIVHYTGFRQKPKRKFRLSLSRQSLHIGRQHTQQVHTLNIQRDRGNWDPRLASAP
jgi:hypothetical protein